MSGNKKQTVKVRDNTVDVKETKDLYGHLMVLARSNRDIDQKQAVGTYEFTLTPDHCLPQMAQCCYAVTCPNLSTHSRRWSRPTQTMQNSRMKAHTPQHKMQIIAKRLLWLMGWS